MNERWKKVRDQAKQQWQQYAPPELQQRVKTWRENWVVARLDFDDYSEGLTKSRREFAQSRLGLVAHVGEVMRGRGGKTTVEADDRTAAWIDNLGEHFHVVASQIAADDVHTHYRAKGLEQFIKEDTDARQMGLLTHRGSGSMYPPSEYDIQTIVYSFADPNKEWVTDPWIEEVVPIVSREEAVELYKQIVADEVVSAMKHRQSNIYEYGDPIAPLKTAAIGLGIVAITTAILGSKKRH